MSQAKAQAIAAELAGACRMMANVQAYGEVFPKGHVQCGARRFNRNFAKTIMHLIGEGAQNIVHTHACEIPVRDKFAIQGCGGRRDKFIFLPRHPHPPARRDFRKTPQSRAPVRP